MIKTILFILAAIFFGLDAFRVPGKISWTPAGFCVLTIALFLV
jgi:cytochrome c oxidase subunit IV